MKNTERSKTVTLTLTDDEWKTLLKHVGAFDTHMPFNIPPTALAKVMFLEGMSEWPERVRALSGRH